MGTTTAGHHGNNMHSSQLENKIDPRVDSDFDHRGNPGSKVGGYGKQESARYGGASGMPSDRTSRTSWPLGPRYHGCSRPGNHWKHHGNLDSWPSQLWFPGGISKHFGSFNSCTPQLESAQSCGSKSQT